jgi:hypothetical protein
MPLDAYLVLGQVVVAIMSIVAALISIVAARHTYETAVINRSTLENANPTPTDTAAIPKQSAAMNRKKPTRIRSFLSMAFFIPVYPILFYFMFGPMRNDTLTVGHAAFIALALVMQMLAVFLLYLSTKIEFLERVFGRH